MMNIERKMLGIEKRKERLFREKEGRVRDFFEKKVRTISKISMKTEDR